MNTIFKDIENILKSAGIEEYRAEARLIILEVSSQTTEEIIASNVVKNMDKILEVANKRAITKEPIQNILGYCYFMNEKYIVNKNVLTPRDETEILVNASYDLIKDTKEKINVLEIGIGSGCVSCSLAKKLINKDIEILGVDISLEALEIALENINNLNLVRKVIIRKSDLYSKIRPIEKFDLIVSNPPYIPIKDKNTLNKNVIDYDPSIALFAQDEFGIEFYEKIVKDAKNYLKENGKIAFELGINQSEKVKELLIKNGFKNIQIIKDLANIDRVISATTI